MAFVDEGSCVRMQRWKKASFTIEAAILVPFLLFLFVGVLQIGITFFQNSVSRNAYKGLEKMDTVERFYHLQLLKELGEDIENGL